MYCSDILLNRCSSGIGQISLHPVLIKKGATYVALYGLGNIRDARLSRMFQTPDAVRWMQPEDLEDMPLSEWFNIFVLHQNRQRPAPTMASTNVSCRVF